jgi:hypothetical protein
VDSLEKVVCLRVGERHFVFSKALRSVPGAHSASCLMDTERFVHGGKAARSLRMSGAVPPLRYVPVLHSKFHYLPVFICSFFSSHLCVLKGAGCKDFLNNQ